LNFDTIQNQSYSLYEKLYLTHTQFYTFWKNNVLLTWRWWILLLLSILPWTIWLLVRKKESTDRMLYIAFFVMIFYSAFDMIGISLNLWYHPVTLLPLMPGFVTFDLCVLPVSTMLFIQYFPHVSTNIKAVIFSVINSFIFEPLTVNLGLYVNIHRKYYYSVPITIFIYLVSNHISSKDKFAKLNNLIQTE